MDEHRFPQLIKDLYRLVGELEDMFPGSIKYRACRAREKDRLTDLCSDLRAQRRSAQGLHYETLSRRTQAACRKADRYEIVR